jgi:hypothetical protein
MFYDHITLISAMPLCFYYHSVQFKVILNTTFIIYRTVKQLHVSILHADYHQTCVKTTTERYKLRTSTHWGKVLQEYTRCIQRYRTRGTVHRDNTEAFSSKTGTTQQVIQKTGTTQRISSKIGTTQRVSSKTGTTQQLIQKTGTTQRISSKIGTTQAVNSKTGTTQRISSKKEQHN